MTDQKRDETRGVGYSNGHANAWVGRIAIAIAAVAVAAILAHAFSHFAELKYAEERAIQVSGSASRRIRSDRAIWSARVIARGATVQAAYAVLHRDVPRVRQFLIDHHVPANEIRAQSVQTTELYAHNDEGVELREQITGYELVQEVQVTSGNVNLVARVSRDVTQLIEDGVYIESRAPEYIYTELGEVKVRLVGEATADARARAEQVARNSQERLGRLDSANVGVVQVNAANETEVSWEGVYDRRSIEKDVMVVVSTRFVLE